MNSVLHAWRHPRLADVAGLCIGRIDLDVDPRRCKRLASRIRRVARRDGLPQIVLTSPLARCRDVGRYLKNAGWRHDIRPELLELDFGAWDGSPWAAVPRNELEAWTADFASYRPGGGESVERLLRRARGFDPGDARVIVTHGGWISAALWVASRGDDCPDSAAWPIAPPPGTLTRFAIAQGGGPRTWRLDPTQRQSPAA
jgi:alpha-ribazole phosphatase